MSTKIEKSRVSDASPTASKYESPSGMKKTTLGGGAWECRYQAAWTSEFKLPSRKAGPLKLLDDVVDSDQ